MIDSYDVVDLDTTKTVMMDITTMFSSEVYSIKFSLVFHDNTN